MSLKKVNDLLDELGRMLGLKSLGLNKDLCCFLTFDELLVAIEYNQDTDRCVLSSPIGGIPEQNRQELYELLLAGNHFWKETGGATLSIDKETGLTYLLHNFSAEHTSFTAFSTILENFIKTLERWVETIAQAMRHEEIAEGEGSQEHGIKV